MKRTAYITLASAFALAAAAPVMAGNLDPAPEPAPVVAPIIAPVLADPGVNWTGFYLGAQAAYGFGDVGGTDFDGPLGGVHAGYNYDFGNVVIGGEADYNFGELKLEGGGGDSIDQIARVKGKVGYDLGQVLIYGTAGAAWADGDIGGANVNDFGYAVGAGADFLVTDNIIAGLEYLYHGFDNFDNTGSDVTVNTIAAKVSFKF